MPLTRGDKMIIAGAAGLAITVVLGLAVLKKPYLFSGRTKAPTSEIPPAPSAGPAAAPGAALPLTAPPAAVATPPASTPAPAPAAAPAPTAATPGKSPLPKVPGDESLEKMFEELANEAPSGGKSPAGKTGQPKAEPKAEAKAPAAASTPAPAAGPTPVEVAGPEPQAAPAPDGAAEPAAVPGESAPPTKPEAKPDAKAGSKAAAKAEAPKPPAAAKAEAKPAAATKASGNVIRIIAEERPGEYVLVIQTNKPPTNFERKFYTDPPRLVLDIAGSWNYNGPLSSATGDPFIRQIRVGKHPDLFRVVLDMAPDAPARLRGAPVAERVPEGVALKIPK